MKRNLKGKWIIGAVVAAVLLSAVLGGVALADDGDDEALQPGAVFQEKLAEKLGITVEELQAKMTEVREEMQLANPNCVPGPGGPAGHFRFAHGQLGADIDGDVFREAMSQARERIQAGEDRETVMAEVMAEFGIDVDAIKARFAENADGDRPLRGFMGLRGRAGLHGCDTTVQTAE